MRYPDDLFESESELYPFKETYRMTSKGYLLAPFREDLHSSGKIGSRCIMKENSLGISKFLRDQGFTLRTKCVASNGNNSKRVAFEAFGGEDLSGIVDQNTIVDLTRISSEVSIVLTHHANSKGMRSRGHCI